MRADKRAGETTKAGVARTHWMKRTKGLRNSKQRALKLAAAKISEVETMAAWIAKIVSQRSRMAPNQLWQLKRLERRLGHKARPTSAASEKPRQDVRHSPEFEDFVGRSRRHGATSPAEPPTPLQKRMQSGSF